MRRLALSSLALALLATLAHAEPRYGWSTFGDLKYPKDFAHFDYVDPNAPQGGKIVTIGTAGITTFDSLNGYILKGDPAQMLSLLFDSLMEKSLDEPDALYGLVAETIDVPDDRSSATFKLRPEAKFSDGTPLTAADVVETFRLLKEFGHENIRISIRDVSKAEALDDHTVKYTFTGENRRDLPGIVAQLPIFSKAYYATHDFSKTTLEPPLGSGPYKVGDFRQGEYITYVKRPDYWAKDLPVNRGMNNFGEIRLEYFRDRTAELESIKAGKLDLREEFSSKAWATEYKDLSSVRDGRLKTETLPDETATGAQGFFLNMRRPVFQDPKVRQAMELAFDFEWSNKNLFYGLYERTASVFENSPCKAEGTPSPAELALLEPYRADVPAEAFGEVPSPPVSDGSGRDRKLLSQASKLLDEAGWKVDGTVRKNAKGEPLKIEFLLDDSSFERIVGPYVQNLKRIGVDASIRVIDDAQYQQRLKSFDFDTLVQRFGVGETPGVELNAFFSSSSADAQGSFNLAGVKSKAVDALISKVTQATSREDLTTACRALDRVLRSLHFWVPQWHKGSHTIVYWDVFGRPAVKPKYARGILETWWIDPAKAANVRRGP
ncbi:MAG: extracellular solute-binding protein [Hyphomicrobiales bacterium]